jgi:hypothetical protein
MATDPWDAFPDADPAPAQASPFGNRPVIRQMPKPEQPKTTYRTLSPDEVKARGLNPENAYQVSSEGSVSSLGPIGPKNAGGNPLPASVATDFRSMVSSFDDLKRATSSFNSGYSHPGARVESMAQGVFSSVGTPGQRDWWADFRRTDNITRNTLFGASLSAGERAAYAETTITPNMDPAEVKRNLERRLQIAEGVLARQKEFLIANGYKEGAINALLGPQQAPAPEGPAPAVEPTAMQPATTEKTEIDPSLTPIRREYIARLQAGQSGTQLVAFLRKSGITDTALLQAAAAQAKHRRENPNTPISAYETAAIDHLNKSMSSTNQTMNELGQSGAGSFLAHAGNAVTGNNLDSIIGMTGGNPEQARLALEYSARDNPTSALAGEIVGGTTAALGGEAALARLGMGGGFGRALAADSGYGAVAGAGASDDSSRLTGALMGGTVGAIASGTGQGIMRGASKMARGVNNPDARLLRDQGIDALSVGQAAGGTLKNLEDKATSVPLLGDAINRQRTEAYRQFNAKAFDKALEPIGGTVNGLVGEPAIAASREQVSKAFDKALAGKLFAVDEEFGKAARGPIERLSSIKRDNLGQEIIQRIEEVTMGHFDDAGNLTGENFQAMLGSLREIRQAYKNDPMASRINDAVKGFEKALEGMVVRADPSVIADFNAAKGAYRRVSILEDAVNAGKNKDGMFTTGQLGMADRANTKKFDGKAAAASGGSPFHDFQRAAQNVLPSTVPDSGTAGRAALMAAVPGVLLGGGDIAMGDGPGAATGVGLGLSGALAMIYSRTGQRKLVERILKQNPILADKLANRARLTGATFSSALLGTTLDQ